MRLCNITFLFAIVLLSCHVGQKEYVEKLSNSLIEDSIKINVGEFDLIDSATINVRSDLVYYSWIIHRKKQDDCVLCVFSWEKYLKITDVNTTILDCSGAEYSNDEMYSYMINSRSGQDFVITGSNIRFTFTVENDGAYIDSVFLYRKSYIEGSVLLESAQLDKSTFGRMRIKDFSNDLFDKYHWNFHIVSDLIDSENWVNNNSLLDNHLLDNLKNEETLKQIQWFDIPEIFKKSPLDMNNVSIYNDAAVFLIKNEMYNEARIILLEITQKYPEKEEAWFALGDAQWGNGDEEDARESYNVYLDLMKKYNKNLVQIPKRVYERVDKEK